MAVDMARRPYTTRARFFRDDDREIKIKWVPADPARGTFPGVSRVCSLDWVTHPETAEGVGEVFGASRNYNRGKPFVGIEGNHFCGTLDEHRNGEVFDPSRPATKYNPSGLPLCCDPHLREANGMGTVTSSTYYTRWHTYRPSGTGTVRNATRHVTGHGRTSDAFFAFKSGVTHATDSARFSDGKGTVTNASHYVQFAPTHGGGEAAGKNGSVWTHSVVCADLTDTYGEAPLTWTDHECSTPLPTYGDGVPIFPDGWRRIEIVKDTDYQFRWRYLLGVGIGGTVEVFIGTEAGPAALVYEEATTGSSGAGDFNSASYDRVFVHLISPESDTTGDELIQETATL